MFIRSQSKPAESHPIPASKNHEDRFFADVDQLRCQVSHTEADIQAGRSQRLPGNVAFLADGRVLCRQRLRGDSRYPYGSDGFSFWVNASGYMHGNYGLFFLFLASAEGQEPRLAFFGGCRPEGAETFVSHALLPVPYVAEGESRVIDRYAVIGHDATYFLSETPEMLSAVRVFVDQTRPEHAHLHFSVLTQNVASQPLEMYTSAYMNPFCRHQFVETNEDRWFKRISLHDDSTLASLHRAVHRDTTTILPPFAITTNEDVDRFRSITNFAIVRRGVTLASSSTGEQLPVLVHRSGMLPLAEHSDDSRTNITAHECTSRIGYVGSPRRNLNCASFFTTGCLKRDVPLTVFNENAIVGDLLRLSLPVDSYLRTDYVFSIPESREIFELELERPIGAVAADQGLQRVRHRAGQCGDLSFVAHGPATAELEIDTLNRFFPYLKKQVAVCAMLKGYMNPSPNSLIGFRDVLQAIDGHLFDKPAESRTKILEVLNHVLVDGRCPRQYSLPVNGAPGRADLRQFVDQGVWAISTVYNYVSVTGDAALLNEMVGYHEIDPTDKGLISPANDRDSVLEHLLRIMDYLARHRDPETGLVLALYGDWNDALDGLGTSSDPQQEFGTGVSAMTSLQVYQNCAEMLELLTRYTPHRYRDHVIRYERLREQLRVALPNYLVVQQGEQRRILHGWGDQQAYFVGSFQDSDGLARDGLISNAFWILSEMIDEDPSLGEHILAAFARLDSPYGFKTFEPGFAPDAPGVGRITKLPRGTAENGATYVHATTFAIAALFRMGEPEMAWKQIIKILPFSQHHLHLSHSPFVMPNSYVDNPQLNLHGQSMNDWQTGCSNVLLKLIVRYVCGFQPQMDHLRVAPASWHPFQSLEVTGVAHGRRIQVVTSRGDVQQREFQLNGQVLSERTTDEISGITVVHIPYDQLDRSETNVIVVTDRR